MPPPLPVHFRIHCTLPPDLIPLLELLLHLHPKDQISLAVYINTPTWPSCWFLLCGISSFLKLSALRFCDFILSVSPPNFLAMPPVSLTAFLSPPVSYTQSSRVSVLGAILILHPHSWLGLSHRQWLSGMQPQTWPWPETLDFPLCNSATEICSFPPQLNTSASFLSPPQ